MIRHMRHGSPPRLIALQSILSPNPRESLPIPSAGVRMTSLTFHVPRSEAGRMAMPMMVADGDGLRPIVSEESVPFPVTGGRILFDPERAFSAEAYPSGGGGATSTLVDYVRFARLLLNRGELDG